MQDPKKKRAPRNVVYAPQRARPERQTIYPAPSAMGPRFCSQARMSAWRAAATSSPTRSPNEGAGASRALRALALAASASALARALALAFASASALALSSSAVFAASEPSSSAPPMASRALMAFSASALALPRLPRIHRF